METLFAYLHFGRDNEPRLTVRVEARKAPLWFHVAGLQETASGYGRHLASPYMVLWEGRWRRVYICQISNAGTAYIGKAGDWLATVDIETEMESAA